MSQALLKSVILIHEFAKFHCSFIFSLSTQREKLTYGQTDIEVEIIILNFYLAFPKRPISDKNEVMLKTILPGTMSDGM